MPYVNKMKIRCLPYGNKREEKSKQKKKKETKGENVNKSKCNKRRKVGKKMKWKKKN
jgi:hypothetical protein